MCYNIGMAPNDLSYHSKVSSVMSQFSDWKRQTQMTRELYVSKHFVQRMVERNMQNEAPFVFKMLTKVVWQLRNTTFNQRTYKIVWKNLVVIAKISKQEISNSDRYVVAKTLFYGDEFDPEYDEVIKL